MPNLKSNPPNKPSALLRPSNAPGRIRSLQSANRDALHMLGHAAQSTGDLKGQALRQLRVQLGIDPSLLATQACMSLSQLYELEDGGNSRFYSDSLRRQAGRRVARLLGADWDNLSLRELSNTNTSSNVVPLQRHTLAPISTTFDFAETAPEHLDDFVSPIETFMQVKDAQHPRVSIDQAEIVSIGLATPASETVFIDPPAVPYAPTLPEPERSSSGWTTFITLLLVIAAGVGGAYAFVEYSPYRLYWPW